MYRSGRKLYYTQKQLKQLIPAEDVLRTIEEASAVVADNVRTKGEQRVEAISSVANGLLRMEMDEANKQIATEKARTHFQAGKVVAQKKATKVAKKFVNDIGNAGVGATTRATGKLWQRRCSTRQLRRVRPGPRPPMSLEEKLRRTRRELQAARHVLQERRFAKSMPMSSEITVQALKAVLNHSVPPALAEAHRDRARLAEQLRIARAAADREK
jgi:hypothetical protein